MIYVESVIIGSRISRDKMVQILGNMNKVKILGRNRIPRKLTAFKTIC